MLTPIKQNNNGHDIISSIYGTALNVASFEIEIVFLKNVIINGNKPRRL